MSWGDFLRPRRSSGAEECSGWRMTESGRAPAGPSREVKCPGNTSLSQLMRQAGSVLFFDFVCDDFEHSMPDSTVDRAWSGLEVRGRDSD
eukprot:949872-Pyramimonas_sp.AAC.1